jgi:hypothetical protein
VVLALGFVTGCSGGGSGSGNPGSAGTSGGAGTGGPVPAVSQKVGPSGATLTLADRTRIEVPPGALQVETTITVRPTLTAVPLPEGASAGGTAYAFEPHGLTFAMPVTLVLPLASTANLGSLVVMKLSDDQDTTWEEVDGATPDRVAAEVRVPTTSFSIYQPTRRPPRFDMLLPGTFPVESPYVDQGGPLVEDGYVYWSPADGTIRSAPLVPDAQVSTIVSVVPTVADPKPEVILKALGGGIAYYLTGSVVRPLGLPGKAPPVVPVWTSDITNANTSLKHWLVHEPIIWAGSTAGRIYTNSGVVDETDQPLPYIDGSCVLSPDQERTMCRDIEFEFGTRAQRKLIDLSPNGAANVGVAAANETSWFAIDGESSSAGAWTVHRIPFGGGADEIVASGPDRGTGYTTALATNSRLYVLRGCHQLTTVTLEPTFPTRTKELMLDGNGPCIAFVHADTNYVYLDTAIGLIRMTHAELQR